MNPGAQPSISVAIATHQGERYLATQLESLGAQSCLPSELVACDDASTDGTLEILEGFARGAPFPVRVLRHRRREGHAQAFFDAAEECGSEAIAFCDQDDIWQPHKLARCAAALRDPDVGLVVHRSIPVDADLRPVGRGWPRIRRSHTDPPLRHGALDTYFPGMAMVVRRSLLGGDTMLSRPPTRYAGGGPMHHDEFAQFMANALGRIHLIARSLVLYRQHAGNLAGLPVTARRQLVCDVGHYQRNAALCDQYADWLATVRVTGPKTPRRQERAVGAYRQAAEFWRARASLHSQSSRGRRVLDFTGIASRGGYRTRERCGLGGVPSAAKDLAVAVMPAGWRPVPSADSSSSAPRVEPARP